MSAVEQARRVDGFEKARRPARSVATIASHYGNSDVLDNSTGKFATTSAKQADEDCDMLDRRSGPVGSVSRCRRW